MSELMSRTGSLPPLTFGYCSRSTWVRVPPWVLIVTSRTSVTTWTDGTFVGTSPSSAAAPVEAAGAAPVVGVGAAGAAAPGGWGTAVSRSLPGTAPGDPATGGGGAPG